MTPTNETIPTDEKTHTSTPATPPVTPHVAQIPGGPELLVVLVVLLLLFGPVLVGVVVLLRYLPADDEVAALEARVDELEARIDGAGGENAGSADADPETTADDGEPTAGAGDDRPETP